MSLQIPTKGTAKEELLNDMRKLKHKDANWKDGRTWSLVYYAGEEIQDVIKNAYTLYMSENLLNPTAFPSLRKFETEVVEMTAKMLNGGPEVVGTMTSGGTESILLAVKTARDWGKSEKKISEPEMIIAETAHPAFEKAAQYFNLKPIRIPLTSEYQINLDKVKESITDNTVLIVGSAPAFPHGVMDPIEELAEIASQQGILLHVDSCLGGFMLPFAQKLGYNIPKFDFAIPGVTSMSADIHKYGYAAKGASVILYKNKSIRRHQFTLFTDFPGGVYISPTMAGTRPGGPIAAAWAILNYLGEEGYLKITEKVMDVTNKILEGIKSIPELYILGDPSISVLAFSSRDDGINIYAVGDALESRGWHMDRLQMPPALHLMVTPAHEAVQQNFIEDLRAAVEDVRKGVFSAGEGNAAMYGMLATLPDRELIRGFVLDLMDDLTTYKDEE